MEHWVTVQARNIRLVKGARIHRAKPFPVPKIHKETLKTEINILIHI